MIRGLVVLSLVFVATANAAAPQAAPELGRLFFTPAERAALDRPLMPEPAPATTGTLRVDGILRSRSGRSTIWLDGSAQPPNEHLQVEASPRLRLVATGTPARRLHIGERHAWPGGERLDPLPEVQVRRTAPIPAGRGAP